MHKNIGIGRYWIIIILALGLLFVCIQSFTAGMKRRAVEEATAEEDSVIQQTLSEGTLQLPEEGYEPSGLRTYDPTEFNALIDGYAGFLEPGDDSDDFRWKYDYEMDARNILMMDSKNYSSVFKFDRPTEDELMEILYENPALSEPYRTALEFFIQRWLELWPESDLSVMKYNLEDLKFVVVDPSEMFNISGNLSTVACYSITDNLIYVNGTLDFSDMDTADFQVLLHELIHMARGREYDTPGKHVTIGPYADEDLSIYLNEGIVNALAWQLQGSGKPYYVYILQTNYLRFIMETVGYDGADYMNHSCYYLMDRMDDYMGDDQQAYRICALIGIQAAQRYIGTTEAHTSYDNFIELYDYLIRMYCRKNYSSGSTAEDVMNGFDEFWEIIAFQVEVWSRWTHYSDIADEDYMRLVYETYVGEHYR